MIVTSAMLIDDAMTNHSHAWLYDYRIFAYRCRCGERVDAFIIDRTLNQEKRAAALRRLVET